MNNTDFPEYGRQCELNELHGVDTTAPRWWERNGYRFIIEFSSGATIEVYPDEITFD